MKEQTQLPQSRNEDLACQELPDEMLVYDLRNHKAHCLNPTATQVWKSCDGKTTVPEMAKRLAQKLNSPISEEVVWLAIGQLEKAQLLENRVKLPIENSRMSRRQILRKAGQAATVPLVISIIAPTAAAGGTCIGKGNSNCTPATCGQLCASCMAGGSVCTQDNNPPGTVTCQMDSPGHPVQIIC